MTLSYSERDKSVFVNARVRWLTTSALALTVGLTVWSMWSTYHRRGQVPQRDTWREAAARVKLKWREGDRVTWYPVWAEEARLALHGLEPLQIPLHGEVDLGRASRLWVLGAFGYDGSRLIDDRHLKILQTLKVLSQEHIQRQSSGPVSITLLGVEGHRVVGDLVKDLADQTRVEVTRRHLASSAPRRCDLWALEGWHCQPKTQRRRREVQRCLNRPLTQKLRTRSKRRDLYSLDRRRWLPYVDCKLNPTEHVSRDWRVIGEHPRRCVWMAPHRGHEVTLRWTPQPNRNHAEDLSDAYSMKSSAYQETLWISWGWEDLAIRHPFRSSRAQKIDVKVERGSEVNWAQSLKPRQGWHTHKIQLPQSIIEGPPTPISISVRAPQDVNDAAFCIDLTIR